MFSNFDFLSDLMLNIVSGVYDGVSVNKIGLKLYLYNRSLLFTFILPGILYRYLKVNA